MDELFLALRVLVSLAAVLGIIWYAQRRISRGSGRTKAHKPITVVGRQAVGAKASVAVVDVDGKRFLLGVTEQGVSLLHTSDTPPAPAEAFSQVLQNQDAASPVVLAAPELPSRSALAGSILSADTWRRAFASLRP